MHNSFPGLPTREERLILALGLGGYGNNLESLETFIFVDSTYNLASLKFVLDNSSFIQAPLVKRQARRCPKTGGTGRICQHIPGKNYIIHHNHMYQ